MKDYFSELPTYNNNSGETETSPAPPPGNPVPAPIPPTPEIAVIMGAVDITKESIRCFTDYVKCKEHEKTERKRISATLRAIQYQIDAQKEVYLKELENKFKERDYLYHLAEKAQEKALELGDKEMLQLCYNFILNVYNQPYELNQLMTSLSGNSFHPQKEEC